MSAQRRYFGPRQAKPSRWRVRFALLPILLLALPGEAGAWSAKGHAVVVGIAEQYLEPRAAEQLRLLLALDNETSLAAIAISDEPAPARGRESARWHDVYIPLRAAAYDAGRDCGSGACIVGKLDYFVAALRNRTTPPRERLQALKYVVLLAGEIHQPMHAVDNGDRGGRMLVVICDGRQTTLRALWDDELLNRIADPRAAALELGASVTAHERHQWQKDSVADWANESHAIAKGFVYRYLPASGILPGGYEAAAMPVALDRLKHAGIRLAGILNRSL